MEPVSAPTRLCVNACFDSGNIVCKSAADPNIVQLEIRPDPFCKHDNTSHFQWFHFRITGARNVPLTLKLVNAGKASFPVAWTGYKACASYDTETFFRVPTSWDPKAGVITIKHTPEQDATWFAYFTPYTLPRHQALIAATQLKPQVRLEAIGPSLDGRDVDLLHIGNAGPNRRQVWIVARQHPGEAMAEWFMEGLLECMTNEHNAFAVRLLQHAQFHVVPNMNPDGSYRGHLRTNASGANLNREWKTPTLERSPEVFHVMRRMDELGCDLFLDIHGDEEIAANFLAGSEGVPSYNEPMAALAKTFLRGFERATPDFQAKLGYEVDKPGEADMTIASNAVAERFKCLSFTLEMPFKDTQDCQDSVHGWNPERAKNFGASILAPIYECLPDLLKPREGASAASAANGTAKATKRQKR
ncbi:hypothetical protein WJX81_007531 [Elliptochloris bilobata]|uniref:Peptidase M14 domain-containing protein n=1 Tax=Elliptochloris bilobata TaxID=381761 RepID=A0AAW1RFU0_9CHLO